MTFLLGCRRCDVRLLVAVGVEGEEELLDVEGRMRMGDLVDMEVKGANCEVGTR